MLFLITKYFGRVSRHAECRSIDNGEEEEEEEEPTANFVCKSASHFEQIFSWALSFHNSDPNKVELF